MSTQVSAFLQIEHTCFNQYSDWENITSTPEYSHVANQSLIPQTYARTPTFLMSNDIAWFGLPFHIIYKNYMACILQRLPAIIQQFMCRIHRIIECWCRCSFSLFVVFHCMTIPQFIYPFCCWKAALCGGGGDEKAWEEGSRDFTFNTVHQYLISRNRKQAK